MSSTNRFSYRMVAFILIASLVSHLFTFDFYLPTEAASEGQPSFTFTVKDINFVAVEGATVYIYKAGEENVLYSANTDRDGIAAFDLDSNFSYKYSVEKQGYKSVSKTDVTVTSGGAIDVTPGGIDIDNNAVSGGAISFKGNIDVVLEQIPAVTLTGKVTDGSNGIKGAVVSLSGYVNYSVTTNDDGSFEIKNVYDTGIYVMKIVHSNYKTIERNANLSVSNEIKMELKSEQAEFKFQNPTPAPIDFGTKFENAASGGSGTGNISYEVVDGKYISSVDDKGKLTIKYAGSITVRAIKASDDNYKMVSAEYTLNINPAQQAALVFETPQPVAVKYKKDLQFSNPVKENSGSGIGSVTYRVINEAINGYDVADVDTYTGTVSIKKAGTVTIQAKKAGDDCYKETYKEYTLKINKGDQERLTFEKPLPEDIVFKKQGTFLNLVSGGSGSGSIKYEIVSSDNTVANINADNGLLSIRRSGVVTVRATKAADSSYQEAYAEYNLTIKKAGQAFGFNISNPSDIVYGTSFTNVAKGENENGKITYKINKGDAATVNASGELNILKAGTIEVQATMAEDDCYNSSVAAYTLTIKPAKQTGFAFKNTAPENITYGKNVTFSNIAEGGQGTGTVTYEVTGGDAAEIEATTGKLNIIKAGTLTVCATKAADSCYEETKAYYTLTIDKAVQDNFAFKSTAQKITYSEGASFLYIPEGGSGEGAVIYTISSSGNVAEIAPATGKLKINKAGRVVVYSTKAADSCYYKADAYYVLTIDKADQTGFVFSVDGPVNITYGTKFANTVLGGQGTGKVCYSITNDPGGLAGIDENTGELKFNDNKTGTIEVTATKATDERYNSVSAKYTLNVNFLSAPAEPYQLSGDKIASSEWFKGDVTITPAAGYKISYSNSLSNNTWKDSLPVNTDGSTKYAVYLKNELGEITDVIEVSGLNLDKTKPSKLSVSYSKSVTDIFLESVLFGFYKDKVDVTIVAEDITSGVDSFKYSYIVDQDTSSTNAGAENQTIPSGAIIYTNDGKDASATFLINAQFRGKVTFSAADKAGNVAEYSDTEVIVADNVAPGVSVSYDNNDAQNGNFYNKARIAKINITEANFFGSDVIISVGKRLNSQTEYTNNTVSPTFVKEEGDVYTASILFDEDADYTFDISYIDKSGNVYSSYNKDEFTIDKTKPVINVTYDNTSVKNGKFYKKERTAKIEITEHNFDPREVSSLVSVKDIDNKDIAADDYASYLKNPANWSTRGDTHTASILFSKDGYYTFDISCLDMAYNAFDDYALDAFVIDKASPEKLLVSYSMPVLDTVLENISFGFYSKPVNVTISAEDASSGLYCFLYSYVVDNDASEKNEGKFNQLISEGEVVRDSNKIGKASFSIDPQFRGKVSFYAVDRASNMTLLSDNKEIVADNIAPGVTVSYDNNDAVNTSYYNKNRVATIKIDEANFFEDDVIVTVGKKEPGEANYTETRVKPLFTKDKDVYTANIEFFEDADYTFNIKYTDKSCNVFDSYKKDVFTIDKTKPEVEVTYDNNTAFNSIYYNSKRTATIKVKENNFNAADFEAVIKARSLDNSTIPVTDYAGYLKNPANWKSNGDIHTAIIDFTEDAQYNIDISYTDFAGNKADQNASTKADFIIDITKPQNLSIKYSSPFYETVLENISFGFYKSSVNVTMAAEDVTSGIDYFTYSYEVDSGVSEINKGQSNVKVSSDMFRYTDNGKTAIISFEIQPQYRGKLKFSVADKAGNTSSIADNKVIVVDNVAPGVTVSYDNQLLQNDKYYKADRTATIDINEANFFEGDVNIVVGKKLYTEINYSQSRISPIFNKNGDTYTAQVAFTENADYTFDISYTDKSGNVFNSYRRDAFTIDKIQPSIKVTYDNNTATSKKMFKANRTATICINEHNFNSQNVKATVTAKNAEGNDVVVNDFAGMLKNSYNWTVNGDSYTAKVEYTADANYTFKIEYTDLAGNLNSAVDYSSSVAPEEFTIDKKLPVASIQVGKWNSSGKKVWDSFLDTISFGLWTNKGTMATITSSDSLSGIDYVKYFRTDTPMTLAQVESKSDGWSTGTGVKTSFNINPDEQFIVYSCIADKAGNTIYISSDGIIADSSGPKIEKLSPEITVTTKEKPRNMIFKNDVLVDIVVADPVINNSVYSGLKLITYQVTNMGNITQEGKLYSFDKINPLKSDLKQQWKGSIVVDSKKNNSNSVDIKVTASDNAGNTITKVLPIKIDITVPTIKVSYDNNNQDSAFKGYFKSDRTVDIIITERNFDKNDVKLSITNSNGKSPVINDWVTGSGSGNNDDVTHTLKVNFINDGDYTFDISYIDLADNKNSEVNYGNSVEPKTFTIDKTIPKVTVNYSTNDARSTNYFNASRVATISINEHNFDTSRVKISMTSSNGGGPAQVPGVSQWSSNGDLHTATIRFDNDSMYTFDIDFADKAGNKAADFAQQSFYIDKTVPKLSIEGVKDKSSNKGNVMPVVKCSDTNIDLSNVHISLTGANRKSVRLNGTAVNTTNGIIYTFKNFEKIKAVDDLYTLSVDVPDKAGNKSHQSVSFSVNRFGSTYTVSEPTGKITGKFIPNEQDIVLTETNVDTLRDIKITMFKDDTTKVMHLNEDYTVKEIGGKGMWHQYVYTIKKDNFAEDGVYRLTVYSVDGANNKSENSMQSKLKEISFGIDKTQPNIIVADLEDGKTYPLYTKPVAMLINDNLKLKSVKVELNGKEVKNWSEKDINKIIQKSSDFDFAISGDSTKSHTVEIIASDAAGNKKVKDIKDFFVTTNLWVRFVNNKPVFFGVIGGTSAVVIPSTAFAVMRRRKIGLE